MIAPSHGGPATPDRVPALVRVVRSFDSEAGIRRLRVSIVALLLVAVTVLVGRGGSRPRDPSLADTAAGPVASTRSSTLAGFGEESFTVDSAAGLQVLCAMVADTEPQRERGLMARKDLGGYDAMVFRFPTDVTTEFYMRNTPLPLSIAWFGADGRFVSATDMTPCPDFIGCPTYSAAGPYRLAVEVPRGALGDFGIGPGSSIGVGGACHT